MTEDFSGLIAQYLDDELDSSGCQAVESTLAKDDSTASVAADYRRIRNSLNEYKPVEPSAGFCDRVMDALPETTDRVIPFLAARRFIAPAAAAAVLVLAFCLQPYWKGGESVPAIEPVEVLSLVSFNGEILREDGNVAQTGDIFLAGNRISTPRDGFARLATSGGGETLLGPGTELALAVSEDGFPALEFESGSLLAFNPFAKGGAISVAGIQIDGSSAEFGIFAEPSRAARLTVERGEALVTWDDGSTASVTGGSEIRLLPDDASSPTKVSDGAEGARLARMLAMRSLGACGVLSGTGTHPASVEFSLRPASAAYHDSSPDTSDDSVTTRIGAGVPSGRLEYRSSGRVDLLSGDTRLAVKGPGQELRMLSSEGRLYIEGAGAISPFDFGLPQGSHGLVPSLSPGGTGTAGVSLINADAGAWDSLMGNIASEMRIALSQVEPDCTLIDFDALSSEASFRLSLERGTHLEFVLDRADYLPRTIRCFSGGVHQATLDLNYSPDFIPAELDFTPQRDAIPADVGAEEFNDLLKQSFGELPVIIDLGPLTDTNKE